MKTSPKRIIIVGGGVAGSEAGTYIGQHAQQLVEVIEIEADPLRRFGGWGFQDFPATETTNLALRKMYLGPDSDEIISWSQDLAVRASWPEPYKASQFDPDQPFPRILMKEYVTWRRRQVNNSHMTYTPITGEAVKVATDHSAGVAVTLADGRVITGDQLVMASGSITVKVPDYLQPHIADARVIIDPLTREGHARRAQIPLSSRILVLGTGLTGEEQINVLVKAGQTKLTLLSREGLRHYAYPKQQKNLPLKFEQKPEFFAAETPEEFKQGLEDFYAHHLNNGHSPEDIIAAIRPLWDGIRAQLGGCVKAAQRLHEFKRALAVNSIGTSWEVSKNVQEAEQDGRLKVLHGFVQKVTSHPDGLHVAFSETREGATTEQMVFDVIINAVGRNIIRHSIWEQMLAEGLALKHAGIGVQVTEKGEMRTGDGGTSRTVCVIGMPRAGDHTLRHGFLGNTAFNVPQVRSHTYSTIDALLERLKDNQQRAAS